MRVIAVTVNPFPRAAWGPVDLSFCSDLWLCRAKDASAVSSAVDPMYIVAHDFLVDVRYGSEWVRLTVPAGLLTDLASVPKVARSFAGRVGRHLEAAIVHDWLYGHPLRNPNSEREREFADAVFLAGMVRAKVPKMQRWLIHKAVRGFGQASWQRGTDEYVDVSTFLERVALHSGG